ncbi:hypothetical protein [Myxococcus sp. CA040A]|uniref:hypothetical protein n=1 Tax=Myxococcus sp. CA040A TaxID=2741738 RepID=UPI00157A2611|nr:hypothetical protein [Myxococcus sp. CA040A]NTX08924.1 hypothetical protein [Myxococcus sp. CA040A]
MIPVRAMVNGYSGPRGTRIACAGCGKGRVGTAEEVQKTERAERANNLLDAGKIHDDRGCSCCNGPLPRERFRLCADCVEADNEARQVSMFPEVSG